MRRLPAHPDINATVKLCGSLRRAGLCPSVAAAPLLSPPTLSLFVLGIGASMRGNFDEVSAGTDLSKKIRKVGTRYSRVPYSFEKLKLFSEQPVDRIRTSTADCEDEAYGPDQ
jgi:hypothetical protein